MGTDFRVLTCIVSFSFLLISFSVQAADECSREWARGKTALKNTKIIGLGLSSQVDPKTASEEARTAAYKDISLQLQSNIQSRSEIKESQSESSFSGSSILTSGTEDLVGLKAIKNGKNSEEKITFCEVYEFNVQAAYDDQASKLSVIEEKIERVTEFGSQNQWLDVIREYPTVKPLIVSNSFVIKRADLFKQYTGTPGPGWGERFEKAIVQLKDMDKKARSNIVFIFPKNQFEEAVTEIEGRVTNAGATVVEDLKDVKSGALGILVSIKSIGAVKKSKTMLGLTLTRKVAIALTDSKTKRKLAANNGLSAVGTSSAGDEEEALANSENQIIGALADAVRNAAPGLINSR